MDVTLSRLLTNGIEASWGPKLLGDSIRAEIKDIDGNAIELRQWLATLSKSTKTRRA